MTDEQRRKWEIYLDLARNFPQLPTIAVEGEILLAMEEERHRLHFSLQDIVSRVEQRDKL